MKKTYLFSLAIISTLAISNNVLSMQTEKRTKGSNTQRSTNKKNRKIKKTIV